MSNEQDLVPSVLRLPDHLAGYIVPATPADLHNNGNEIVDCSICYFEFSPSLANKETTTTTNTNTTTTTTATTTTATAPMEQAEPCLPPVKLALCGHIFCRVCMLVHLNGHRHGPVPPCPMCRQPCYPQTAIPEDTLSDVEADLDDLEALSEFSVERMGEGEEGEGEDRGDILAFIGEDIYGPAETGERGEEIEGDEERVEEDEEMTDYEWEDEDHEDDEEDEDFEPEEEEEVEEEYEEDDEKFDLMELSE